MNKSKNQQKTKDSQDDAKNAEYSGLAVKMESVIKIYGAQANEVEALKGVDLNIKRGEIVTIMGPSGSGKSTLLNMLGAMDFATKGRVVVDGKDVTNVKEKQLFSFRRHSIGFIFQDYYLLPNFNVVDNILTPKIPYGIRKKDKERAMELLKTVGIEEKANAQVTKLSGGQKQRVAIARALINDPRIILADEPTGNLDSETGKQIVDLLVSLADRGKTVIIVTHDLRIGKIVKDHPKGRNIWMLDGLLSNAPSVSGECWG